MTNTTISDIGPVRGQDRPRTEREVDGHDHPAQVPPLVGQ